MPMRTRKFECCSDCATDLQRAFHRIFRTVVKDQRHAVAGRELEQSVLALSLTILIG